MTPLFLDHNAGTVVDPRVLARFLEIEEACPGNPASVHGPGRRAGAIVEGARSQVAAALAVPADDVLFCSGGTEANNCAVRGLGDPGLPVLLAPVEHASVLEPARARGIVAWSVDAGGRAQVTETAQAVGLVCLVHAQSEVGSLQPVVAAAELADKMQVPLHVDAAQTLGRVPLDEVLRVASSVSLSPHKAGGLRGMGVLVVRRSGRGLRPLVLGGGHERGLRAGTVSPSLTAATALAVELAVREQSERAQRMAAARQQFRRALADAAVPCRGLTPEPSLPNTLMLLVEGVAGRSLLPALDLDGIAASHGSACASGSPQPPAVLAAMGLGEDAARACVRFSFGRDDDAASGSAAGRRVAAVLARLQKKN